MAHSVLRRPTLVTYSAPDVDHDRAVNATLDRMWIAENAGRREDAQQCWREAVAMIAKRTPEQVARLERDRGLT